MPRARTSVDDEEVVVTKPRARRARAVSTVGEAVVAPAPRRRAAPRAPKVMLEEVPARKAPTPLASAKRSQTKKTKTFVSVLGVCVVCIGLGVGIGFLDAGEINVVAVVTERNEQINKGEVRDEAGNTITQTIQVQNGDTRPNGGLTIGDPIAVPPPVSEVATSTEATSTPDTVASTTELAVPADTASTTESI